MVLNFSLDCSLKIDPNWSITYLQTIITDALNLTFAESTFYVLTSCCSFLVTALLIFIEMQKVTELNLILFCFILISNISNYLLFYFCNVIRLSKRSLLFLFIYYYIISNINIYVKINFYLLPLSRCDYCIYTSTTHKGVFYHSFIDVG